MKCVIYFSNLKSKISISNQNTHKEFERCKHIELFIESPNISDIDRTIYSCIIAHNKKYDCYLNKCQYKIIFKDNQYCSYGTSKLSDNKKMISWANFLETVIFDFKDKGCNFNHIEEMT